MAGRGRFRADRAAPESGRTNSDVASARAAAPAALDLSLLRELERVVNLDAKVPDCALDLAVTEQQLNRSEVLRPLVYQRCFGAAHRMRAIYGRVKSRRARPSMYHPGILPC
jgi:hypothetical protein